MKAILSSHHKLLVTNLLLKRLQVPRRSRPARELSVALFYVKIRYFVLYLNRANDCQLHARLGVSMLETDDDGSTTE